MKDILYIGSDKMMEFVLLDLVTSKDYRVDLALFGRTSDLYDGFLEDITIESILTQLCTNKRYEYIVVGADVLVPYVAKMNERYNLRGMKKSIGTKADYYEVFKRLNIPHPKTYTKIDLTSGESESEDAIEYPYVIKPARGDSTKEVCIVRNEEELVKYLHHSIYYKDDTTRIVQEFVDGQTITFLGRVVRGKCNIDIVVDVKNGPANIPYECGWSWPSRYPETKDIVQREMQKYFNETGIDDVFITGEYIVDAQRNISIVDMAIRQTSWIMYAVHFCGEPHYITKGVTSILTGEEPVFNFTMPVTVGAYTSSDIPRDNVIHVRVPCERIELVRNDSELIDSSYIVVQRRD